MSFPLDRLAAADADDFQANRLEPPLRDSCRPRAVPEQIVSFGFLIGEASLLAHLSTAARARPPCLLLRRALRGGCPRTPFPTGSGAMGIRQCHQRASTEELPGGGEDAAGPVSLLGSGQRPASRQQKNGASLRKCSGRKTRVFHKKICFPKVLSFFTGHDSDQ
jgi:hypothetical protein